MPDDQTPIWIPWLSSLVGTGALSTAGGMLLQHFRNLRSDGHKERRDDKAQRADQYERFFTRQDLRIETLEKSHKECMDSHVKGEFARGQMHQQIEDLKRQLASTDQRITEAIATPPDGPKP